MNFTGRGKGGKGLWYTSPSGVPLVEDLKRVRDKRENSKSKKRKFCNAVSNISSESVHEPMTFSDISFKFSDTSTHSVISSSEGYNLLEQLSVKLFQHFCNDLCFKKCPSIDWNQITDSDRVIQTHKHNLKLTHICDEECSKDTKEFVFGIIDEFMAESHNFKLVSKEEKKEQGEDGEDVEQLVLEFRACGKICYYVRETYEYEMCFLLMNDYEYVFAGYYGGHPFYGTPVLRYVNSDGSSPGIIEDEGTTFSIGLVLSSFKLFIGGAMQNDYH